MAKAQVGRDGACPCDRIPPGLRADNGRDPVLSRANRLARLFDGIMTILRTGPSANLNAIVDAGNPMRRTAFQGNGKFGSADRRISSTALAGAASWLPERGPSGWFGSSTKTSATSKMTRRSIPRWCGV
jgi:hypothetical protein